MFYARTQSSSLEIFSCENPFHTTVVYLESIAEMVKSIEFFLRNICTIIRFLSNNLLENILKISRVNLKHL